MNVAAYTGRLTDNVELKSTSTGKSVVSFCIAVQRPFSKDATDYIDCVAWDERAEFVSKYFRKGSRIEVSGSMQTRLYESGGKKIKATELVCQTVGFGESKKDSADSTNNGSINISREEFEELADDTDVPF